MILCFQSQVAVSGNSYREVPQGGPLSPLLANVLLDDLDKELERRGRRFVRYADDFIIMVKSRLRMCYWKQWRYARTKVRNLLKLGTFKRQTIMTAISCRGPWHLVRTLATQSGMTNKWLSEQGLISVKEQWVRIHYPATAR